MDRNKAVVMIIEAILIAVVVMSPVACTIHRQRIVQDSVNKGLNPMLVKCSLEDLNRSEMMWCLEVIRNSGNKQ